MKMDKKWSDFESDGRTLKKIVTTLKRRFNELDKDDAEIEQIVRTGEALAKIIKTKHDMAKTMDLETRRC